MAYISTGVEYALHSLLFLAMSDDKVGSVSIRELADLQRLPTDFLAKIFTKLQHAGIVEGIEGVKGGFRLGRSPSAISVLDVVQAIDGRKLLFECQDIRARCKLFGRKAPTWATKGCCSINAIMLEAQKSAQTVLAKRTLADITKRVSAKAPKSFESRYIEWVTEKV
jgi:Rrf2 family protein